MTLSASSMKKCTNVFPISSALPQHSNSHHFDISLTHILEVWDLGGNYFQIIMNSWYIHVCMSTWGEMKKKMVIRYKEMKLFWGQFNGSSTLMSCKKMDEEKEKFWFSNTTIYFSIWRNIWKEIMTGKE